MMTLTRNELAARDAGCRVTRDRPSRYVSDLRLEHRWNCGCVYRFAIGPDGIPVRYDAHHCTPWGDSDAR